MLRVVATGCGREQEHHFVTLKPQFSYSGFLSQVGQLAKQLAKISDMMSMHGQGQLF